MPRPRNAVEFRDDKARLDAAFAEDAKLFALVPAAEHYMLEASAARFIGVGYQTLQAMRRDGVAPRHVMHFGRARYRRADLLAWLARGAQ